MDPCRPVFAAFVISLTFSFAACFGSPTRPTTTSHGSSSSAGGAGGGGAATSKASSVTATSTSGTGATGAGGGGSGGGGTGGATPSDGGWLDVAADAIGKGGLPEGAMCGADGVGDGGSKCGEGLACCYPCKNMMCDTFCTLECNPKMKGCIGGCIAMP